MALSITDEARRILATPLGQQPGCTYVASKADWMRAAQEALDGETADLEFLLSRAIEGQLDSRIAQARRDMGEDRWNELQKEWPQ